MRLLALLFLCMTFASLSWAEDYKLLISVTPEDAVLLREAANGDDTAVLDKLTALVQVGVQDMVASRRQGRLSEIQTAVKSSDEAFQQKLFTILKTPDLRQKLVDFIDSSAEISK